MKILCRWILLGVIELLVCLFLIATIAPQFLNSNYPFLGVLIWLVVLGLLSLSVGAVIMRWIDARIARRLFVHHFPEYYQLTWIDFIGTTSLNVRRDIETFSILSVEPDAYRFQLSASDLLRQYQK
ncbi:hypothetical protein D0962_00275 [Leptolyngbyaceae cyanobacterium CCMR0082]|uniref:DUF304 domain-containing protein n=1 Tax=Adonisia turfae CCMR0082 TaxID=2304604 RepID=A0A6M0RYD1_9CYAN|nr:hypothetical protein [Adonisia turfae]NEZ61225.1 hypothetical protein [Adonisia turfae CCMR0082]